MPFLPEKRVCHITWQELLEEWGNWIGSDCMFDPVGQEKFDAFFSHIKDQWWLDTNFPSIPEEEEDFDED